MVENSPRLTEYEEGMPQQPPPARDHQRTRRITIVLMAVVTLTLTLANVIQGQRLITLRQTGAVTGTVVDERGAPVAGAEIAVPGTRLEATSDAAGRFQLTAIPPGTVTVLVAHHYVGWEHTVAIEPGRTADLGDVRVITALRPDGRADWR